MHWDVLHDIYWDPSILYRIYRLGSLIYEHKMIIKARLQIEIYLFLIQCILNPCDLAFLWYLQWFTITDKFLWIAELKMAFVSFFPNEHQKSVFTLNICTILYICAAHNDGHCSSHIITTNSPWLISDFSICCLVKRTPTNIWPNLFKSWYTANFPCADMVIRSRSAGDIYNQPEGYYTWPKTLCVTVCNDICLMESFSASLAFCGFPGFPLQQATDTELWCFLCC